MAQCGATSNRIRLRRLINASRVATSGKQHSTTIYLTIPFDKRDVRHQRRGAFSVLEIA
jgi:hypothetical protein